MAADLCWLVVLVVWAALIFTLAWLIDP